MIESKATECNVKTGYPKLMIDNLSGLIILAIESKSHGFVSGFIVREPIYTSISECEKMGIFSTDWDIDKFKDYTGTVTLKNVGE